MAVGPDEKQGLLGFRSGLVIELSVDGLSCWSIRDGLSGVLELSGYAQNWCDRATSADPFLLYPSEAADLTLLGVLDGVTRHGLLPVLECFLRFSLGLVCVGHLPCLYDEK